MGHLAGCGEQMEGEGMDQGPATGDTTLGSSRASDQLAVLFELHSTS